MNNDNKKNLRKAFDSIRDENLSGTEQLRRTLTEILPMIKDFRANDGDLIITAAAHQFHQGLAKLDPLAVAFIAMNVTVLDRNEVRAKIASTFANTNLSKATKDAEELKRLVKNSTQAEYVAISQIIADLLPRRTAAYMQAIEGAENKNIATHAKKSWSKLRKMSVEELAQQNIARAAAFPVDAVTDKIMEAAQNFKPRAILTLAEKFTQAVSANDLAQTGIKAAAFAEEFISSAIKDEKLLPSLNSPNGVDFRAQLKKVLQGLEDSAIAAGLVPDMKDVVTALVASRRPQKKGPKDPAP